MTTVTAYWSSTYSNSNWTSPDLIWDSVTSDYGQTITSGAVTEGQFGSTPFSTMPDGSTINSILVEVYESGDGGDTLTFGLYKGGTYYSKTQATHTSATWYAMGSADLWGTTWTTSDLKTTSLLGKLTYTAVGKATTCYVRSCRITVDYTVAATTYTIDKNSNARFSKTGVTIDKNSNARFSLAGIIISKTSDALFSLITTQTIAKTIDARFKATVTASKTSDARFSKAGLTIDKNSAARFVAALTKSVTSDSRFKATVTVSKTVDARFSKAGLTVDRNSNARFSLAGIVKSLTSDALFLAPSAITISVTSDARFSKGGITIDKTVDSRFLKAIVASLASDARFRATITASKTSDARFRATLTVSKASDARFKSVVTRQLTSDAYIGTWPTGGTARTNPEWMKVY